MASFIEQIIPRMFHRRLLLLMVVMIGATGALGAQLIRLTVVEHDRFAAEADAALVRRRLVSTRRGRILDRKQRVLAEDRPCFDIAVDYDVITGERAYRLARKQAWRDYRDRWGTWSFDEREAVIADYRAPIDAGEQRLWAAIREAGGLSEAELESQRRTIVSRVQSIRQDVWQRKAKRREEELGGPIELSNIEVEIAEEREAHTILAAVSDEVKNRFNKLAQADPDMGMRVVNAKARHYPFGVIEMDLDRSTLPSTIRSSKTQTMRVDPTALVLGGIRRQIWEEDVDPDQGGRPFRRADGTVDLGGYLPGDSIGIGGVEQAEEPRLRGLRGQVLVRKDTGEESRQLPTFGQDVTLSIDVMLQARLRAIMEPSFGLMQVQGWHGNAHQPLGTPLSGAAVVMEVDTGEILAMISTPAPAPEGTPGAPTITEMLKDPMRPLVNRAISAVYPPGSTLKPIIYCEAVRQKRLAPHQQIDCRGHLLPNRPDLYRCWTWRPEFGRFGFHGPISADEALARSCNIFFYETGERLKAEGLVSGLHGWGFSRTPGVGLAGEASGKSVAEFGG